MLSCNNNWFYAKSINNFSFLFNFLNREYLQVSESEKKIQFQAEMKLTLLGPDCHRAGTRGVN